MHTSKKIAVAGATGRAGRHVVDILSGEGHDVVAMSRATGVDVITGAGLDEALAGVECIIDVATQPSSDRDAATEFFVTSARNLQDAGARAGVQRMVVASIIGVEHFTGGFLAAKLTHEQAVLAGQIPAQILRAAQFHEFVEQLMQWSTQGEVCYVPNMRTQLVAVRTVAEALVSLATDGSQAGSEAPFPEIAGPRAENLADMVGLLASRRGLGLQVQSVSDPADPDSDRVANGSLLPSPHAKLAGPTFEEWLGTTS